MIVNLEHFIKKYNIKIDTTQQKYYYFEDITIDNILHKVFSRIYYLQNKNNIVNVGLNSIYFKMFIPALNKKRPRNKDYYEYRLSGENAFDICGITFVETNLTETYIVGCKTKSSIEPGLVYIPYLIEETPVLIEKTKI